MCTMNETYELEEFKALAPSGKVTIEHKHPALLVEAGDNGLHFCVKQNPADTSDVGKIFNFSLKDCVSSCRVGNKGYVFNFSDDVCYIFSFQVSRDTQSFCSVLQRSNDYVKSKFSTRTEESSAAQYFQFYGYLSQQQNMLQDYIRTSTYERAVLANTKDFEDKVVLDVGAGSGILSFFSAQAGARRVYAVEASSMAEHAETLVKYNHFLRGQIVVVAGKVEEIELPEQVDIIISEPMGYMLYNERMLETYLHAKKWLKPGGKMFPTTGDLHVAPFTDEALFMEQTTKASFWLQTHFHNVNLTSLHDAAISEYFRQPVVDTFDIRICTAKSVKHTVNFLEADETDLHRIEVPLEFICLQSATVHGLAFWFDVAFIGSNQTIWLSTSPTEPLTHWYQVRCLLSTPIFAKVNQRLVGKVVLEANPRQSYDVTIDLMIDGFPDTRSCNCLDLKNPYFRYTGQATAAPPGTNTVSPSDAYWSQIAETSQVHQMPAADPLNAAPHPHFDISQWQTTNGGGQIQIANAVNNTVSMVNGISLNGYTEMLDPTSQMPQILPTSALLQTSPGSGQVKLRQRVLATVPTSTCASQLIGGGLAPNMFSTAPQQQQQQQQIIIADSLQFAPHSTDVMASDYIVDSAEINATP